MSEVHLESGRGQAAVLVVDDERPNRQLLEALLVSQGYRVLQASDGPAAIQLVREETIGLVLLDMMMPGLDGVEICALMRSEAKISHLPVVMVSALSDRASRLRAKEAGADDYLVKPVDTLELLIRVETLWRNREALERLNGQLAALSAELSAARGGAPSAHTFDARELEGCPGLLRDAAGAIRAALGASPGDERALARIEEVAARIERVVAARPRSQHPS
jgi:two-component system cell cycle response regulator